MAQEIILSSRGFIRRRNIIKIYAIVIFYAVTLHDYTTFVFVNVTLILKD